MYERVTSHICTTRPHISTSRTCARVCHVTQEWVMSHIWMNHATHMNDVSHIFDTCATCRPHIWTSAHLDESKIGHKCFCKNICDTYVEHTCDVPHSYVWRTSFIRVTYLIHMCDVPHSYVWPDSFIWDRCAGIQMCGRLVQMYGRHVSRDTCERGHTYEWGMSHMCSTYVSHMCGMTHVAHTNESRGTGEACDTYEWWHVTHTWKITWVITI